jgi:hypothetical protein
MLGQRSGNACTQRARVAGGRHDLRGNDSDVELSRGEFATKVARGSRRNVRTHLGRLRRDRAGKPEPLAPGLEVEPRLRRKPGEVRLEAQRTSQRGSEPGGKKRREIGELGRIDRDHQVIARHAGGARRGHLRAAGREIDRDIANGLLGEFAARRARQRDSRQTTPLGEGDLAANAPRRCCRAGSDDFSAERAAGEGTVCRRIEIRCRRVDLEGTIAS